MAGDPIEFEIRPFEATDTEDVVALWASAGLLVDSNDPYLEIGRKVAHSPDQFFVGLRGLSIVATVMVGYDGYRGSVNFLAVGPTEQGTGVGAAMMLHAEQVLASVGCAKIGLQVHASNADAIGFYEAIGYRVDDVVALGLRLVDDDYSMPPSTTSAAPVT